MEVSTVLDCGCEYEVINGKVMWIYCDEHDVDIEQPTEYPIKKFRKSLQDD